MDDNLDNTEKLDLSDLNEKPYKGTHRKNNRKALTGLAVAFGVIVLMIGILLNMGGDSKPVANSKPIAVPSSTASPSQTASPKPTHTKSPAPTRTQTPAPTATPAAPKESAVPSSKPWQGNTCDVRALEPPFDNVKAQDAVLRLLEQNKNWQDVYAGKFYFRYETNQQDMNEMSNRVKNDRSGKRAGFIFFNLYHDNHNTINKDIITERLKNVTGPCKELAVLDLNWIEGIADQYKDPANNSSNPVFMEKLNKLAIEWLKSRNAVLSK
ncbi:hypothetical protein [Shimazuella kribbensis]|uniref:hypothetical protein n=1 Tax=Shimazuella kribbensis TaxID=139808 RepID=UPI0003FD5F07|nr:hypothetical protein [Shimazuella kribbensis]